MKFYPLKTLKDTQDVGIRIAAVARPGQVFTLSGELGSGKTTLARSIIQAMGHLGEVRSPTYALYQVFETPIPILHADLYRVESAQGIGLEDFLETHVSIIEWPEALQDILDRKHWVEIRLEYDGKSRQIGLSAAAQQALQQSAPAHSSE
jgi:tRNA threonylcarbamoyladenosine biosynthesis protein TsaE